MNKEDIDKLNAMQPLNEAIDISPETDNVFGDIALEMGQIPTQRLIKIANAVEKLENEIINLRKLITDDIAKAAWDISEAITDDELEVIWNMKINEPHTVQSAAYAITNASANIFDAAKDIDIQHQYDH